MQLGTTPSENNSSSSATHGVNHGFAEVLVDVTQTAKATLPGGITISLGTQRETVTLIVDRLLKYATDQRDVHESGQENVRGQEKVCGTVNDSLDAPFSLFTSVQKERTF